MYKCTMIFRYLSAASQSTPAHQRIGGWTESWYHDGQLKDVQSLFQDNGGLCQARAGCLPKGAAIVGGRYQSVVPKGGTLPFRKLFPGDPSTQSDIPQMSLYLQIGGLAPNPNDRLFEMRAIPDQNVTEGELNLGPGNFSAALDQWKLILGNNGWCFKGLSKVPNLFDIISIAPDGTIQTVLNTAYAVGQTVRILRGKSTTIIPPLRGKFLVTAPATVVGLVNSFKVTAPNIQPSTGGQVILNSDVYPQVDITQITSVEVVTRKIGRPIDLYSGRARRRKK